MMFFIILFLNSSSVFAQNLTEYNFSQITTDQKIIAAISLLNNTTLEKTALTAILGNNLSQKPIRIMFKDLSEISEEYTDFDALACKDRSGRPYIFINQKHKNAPAEAIAALLCHETIHQDGESSIAEEIQGWLNEAVEWHQFKKTNPELNCLSEDKYSLVKRLNTLENMYVEAGGTSGKITEAVAQNEGYKNLALYSPGFKTAIQEHKTASIQF